MRSFVCLLSLALFTIVLFTRAEAKPLNIVVILADDQGWGDLSVHGNRNLKTPHIDSLARDGAIFERFFVCPVCSPTRAEFLTGRYHSRGGVRGVSTGAERLDLDEKTIADAFKAAGYATGCFGKWHNGSQWPYHPNARGFDEYYGFTSGHWGEYFDAPLEHNGELVRGKGYIADDLTSHAIAFIEQHRERPFLCYLPFNTPHSPWLVPDAEWDRFKAAELPMRARPGQAEEIDKTRCALAMCENIDANVGRVLKSLETHGLTQDTLVLYFSDNGPNSWRWNGGMKGRKASTDEGGLRVPCLVRCPGRIPAGTRIPQIAGAIDLLPTLASLADVSLPSDRPLDGKDLSPLLAGTATDWPDRRLFAHFNGKVSVRTQQFRLDANGGLFDLQADPEQTQNIAPQKPDVAKELAAAVAAWRQEVLPKEKDDRPFPIGFREFPHTWLPARDGVPHGQVQRSARAPNCSYFTNWTSRDDSLTWDVDVATAGTYGVTLFYTCPKADVGSTIELTLGQSVLPGKVAPAFDPPLIKNQDRIPRDDQGESYLKEFRPLQLGSLALKPGRGPC